MLKKSLQRIIAHAGTLVVPIIIFSTAISAMAASASFRWEPNDPTPEGYRVFSRRSNQAYNYNQPDWEGSAVTCTIANLEDQTEYYFVARAYDGSLESVDSDEAHYLPPEPTNDSPVAVDDTTPPVTDPDPGDDSRPDSTDEDDGMPDDWETLFGLNPTIDDANGDLDQDGISNRDEYRAGLEPDDPGIGMAPERPAPVSPASYSLVERNPVLATAGYDDSDGDAHIATQWQIFDTSSGDCLLDVITDRRLTRLKVPILLLKNGREYHWRLRFFDSGGRASAWSTIDYFTTESAVNDLDGNGIPDNQEGEEVQIDGVYASLSSPAASFKPTGISVASNETIFEIEQMAMVDPDSFEIDETTPVRLPSALVAYTLVLYQPGQRAWVTIHLSDSAPDGATWVKYDAVNGWQDYSTHAEISADRQSVIVEVKDGGYGDADGCANGIIVDPAGLSTAADGDGSSTSATAGGSGGGGGGGGCLVTTIYDVDKGAEAGHGRWQWFKIKMDRFLTIIKR